MARRRNTGVLGTWAELQRQQQRRREAEERARLAAQRDADRRRREYERDAARGRREALRAYQQAREADATRRTGALDEQVAELRGLLAARLRHPAFHLDRLRVQPSIPPFSPGVLGVPIAMPDPARYHVAPPTGLAAYAPGAQARHEQERAQAHARLLRDQQVAQAAEFRRRQQYDAYFREWQAWAAGQQAQADERNAQVDDLARRLAGHETDAVEDYFTGVLLAAPRWPDGFPDQAETAYDRHARQLVLDHAMPGIGIVPAVARVRYVKTDDRENEIARPATERRSVHRDVLAQCALRILAELFSADHTGALDSVVLNGFIDAIDPATGRTAKPYVVTVTARADGFRRIALDRVDAVSCLEGMDGLLSARPDRPTAVRPARLPASVASTGAPAPGTPAPGGSGGAEAPDLLTMDPLAFEELIAELFRRMGMRVSTTRRSGDEGVDVVAVDPDPIRGGTIVVQAKRYRATVPPTAVRDLAGTVQHHGAIKGILVATSGFGPGSHEFIRNKPLTLISGPELVHHLAAHGLPGRLGPGGPRTGGPADRPLAQLDVEPAGVPPLDPCAFVCARGRVLDDDHFVFHNAPADPGGAVQLGDGVAFLIDLSRLPPHADRLVLAAAVDEEAAPGRDLAGLRGAHLTRLAQADGRTLGRDPIPSRRSGENAMLLGAFARTASGWTFEPAAAGYTTGLAGLATAYGVDIA